jgi:hypothetical protein
MFLSYGIDIGYFLLSNLGKPTSRLTSRFHQVLPGQQPGLACRQYYVRVAWSLRDVPEQFRAGVVQGSTQHNEPLYTDTMSRIVHCTARSLW